MLVDEGMSLLGETFATLGVVEQIEDMVGDILGMIGDEDMLIGGSAQRFVDEGRGDAGDLHRHCLEQFVLQSGTDTHGGSENAASGVTLTDIIDGAADDDPIVGELADAGRRGGASQEEFGVGDFAPHEGHYLGGEEDRGVDVGGILHVAAEDDIVAFLHFRHRMEIIEVDSVGDDIDFEVHTMRYRHTVGFGDDGEGIEDGEGVVFGRTEHLELVVEGSVTESLASVLHAALHVEREGILEVHHLGARRMGHEGQGAHHLGIDNIGIDFALERLVAAVGFVRSPEAYLQRAYFEQIAEGVIIGGELVKTHHFDIGTELFEMFDMLGRYGLMGEAEEVYLVVVGQTAQLMISTQLISFFEGIRESG